MLIKETQEKSAGSYKILKKVKQDNYYAMHYPKTNLNALDDWIQSYMDQTITEYELLLKDQTEQQVRQDYSSKESFNQYTAITLRTYLNDELVKTSSKTYDSVKKEFIDLSIFKENASRVITKAVRDAISADNLERNEFLQATTLSPDFSDIYIDDEQFNLTLMDQNVSLNLKDYPSLLKNDFGSIKADDSEVPAVYLDYGYNKDDKMVAFTFDDGPYTPNAIKFMEILEKYNAKGTFYILGSRIEGQEQTLRDLLNQGHQIAIHSYEHLDFNMLTVQQITDQIEKAAALIDKAAGYPSDYYVRTPYGNLTQDKKSVLPYTFTNWSVDSEDWRFRDAAKICDLTLSTVTDGSIVLMHELYDETLESLECILPQLQKEGYQFVTVKELLEARFGEVKKSALYFNAYQ